MNKTNIFLLALLFLLSCSRSNKQIILDQNTWYNIPSQLELKRVSQLDLNDYKSLFKQNIENPMVLYKVLNGLDVKMYIGIGFETSAQKIRDEIFSNPHNTIIDLNTLLSNSFSIYLRLDSTHYVSHYLKVLDSGNKYLFSIVSNKVNSNQYLINEYIERQIVIK